MLSVDWMCQPDVGIQSAAGWSLQDTPLLAMVIRNPVPCSASYLKIIKRS